MALEPCIVPGWGTGPYGLTPWGGSLGATPGGPIPTVAPFNIYCVGPCGPMSVIDTYDEVSVQAAAGQFSVTYPEEDVRLESGGALSTNTAKLFIDTGLPATWTLEFTAKFTDLPADFNNLPLKHAFVGGATPNDYCAGLFFSLVGIAYTGSVVYDGSGNLVVNSTVQVLPDSLNLVQEDTYYTIRVAVDGATETTFIYVTETAQLNSIGHQLRYVLPAIPGSASAVAPVNGTTISVRGTATAAVAVNLDSICLGTGLLIPNIPPIADAGRDQAVRTCTIARLDGTLSRDPEGANLIYKWRLIDAPDTSSNTVVGYDGYTYTPTPFTNLFHSQTLGDYDAAEGIVAGDVLLLDGEFYDIVGTGTDGNGFYVQIDGFSLPSPAVAKSFKLLKQAGISGPSTAKPTFYPDISGIYKFTLTVNDGQLNSESSEMILNVTESPVPRGCIPDVSFIWNYLSDFWRLVDGTDQYEVFWSSLAQITATELLTLWQTEYSKSLRDIQRTFQRRWLHYDLMLKEPLGEQTTIRPVFRGALSTTVQSPIAGTVNGTFINVWVPGYETPITVTLTGKSSDPANGTPEFFAAQIRKQLKDVDTRFDVAVYANSNTVDYQIHITAPFYFELQADSTAPFFSYPLVNDLARGSGGAAVSVNTYKVSETLQGMNVRDGDYIVIGEESFRIQRVISDASDAYKSMRVVVYGTLPLPAGPDWVIVGSTTSAFLDFYNALVSYGDTAFYEILDKETNELIYLPAKVMGAAAYQDGSILLTDLNTIGPYLALPDRYEVQFDSVFRRTYVPVDSLVVEVPNLQELIVNKDDSAVLRQNIDYYIEEFRGRNALRFVTGESPEPDVWQYELPPQRMWAEVTYIDNRPVIEQNFGLPAEFTLDNLEELGSNVDYLSIVRGLWYAYFNGPTLHNLRVGAQILLGLPFAEDAGTIVEIRADFSPNLGRILVQSAESTEIIRSYSYPRELELEINPATGEKYKEGDAVEQFAPLVEGVSVVDYIKDPEWFKGYIQQGTFVEVEKFFKFMVRVDSAAFSLSTLVFVKNFTLRVKPTYTYPLFIVSRKADDATVDVTDTITYYGGLLLYDVPCGRFLGFGLTFDDPNPGGGWNGAFDSGEPVYAAPTYPTPSPVVFWGYDREILCPSDLITANACFTLVAPAFPTMDGLYAWDAVLFTDTLVDVAASNILAFIPSPGAYVGDPVTSTGAYTITVADLYYSSLPDTQSHDLRLVIEVNAVDVRTIDFTIPAGTGGHFPLPVTSLGIIASDVVRVRLEAQGLVNDSVLFAAVSIRLGNTYAWAYDVQTPAGTYCTTRILQ